MHKLDYRDEIKEAEIYTMRSFPLYNYSFIRPIILQYFDFETQTLEYPYHPYKEEIKEQIERKVILLR